MFRSEAGISFAMKRPAILNNLLFVLSPPRESTEVLAAKPSADSAVVETSVLNGVCFPPSDSARGLESILFLEVPRETSGEH